MPFYLLLAMQASGMIVDFFGAKSQAEMMDMGMKVQQAGIQANIMQTRLETQDASLNSMIELRKNLGSQIAIQAARGTNSGAGSAFLSINESVSNFNADEQTRRLNGLGKENQLRAGAAISRLQNNSDVSKLWQGFSTRTVNRFPSSVAGWKQGIADAKTEWNKPYFGLTDIG